MRMKHFATIILASLLIVTVFGSRTVFSPAPTTPNPPVLWNAFVTNTSDDPVPVDITDDSIDVNLDEPIEVTNPSGESLDVTITNSEPIEVEVKNSGFEPVQFDTTLILAIGETDVSDNAVFLVPSGKMLVIEYVSVHARSSIDSSNAIYVSVSTSIESPGFERHWLGMLEPQGSNHQFVSESLRMYARPLSGVAFWVNRISASDWAVYIDCTMTGYLVDVS
jgi:hypothetical protein